MARQKRKKFAVVEQLDHVIQPGKDLFGKLKGKWNKAIFKNDNDIVLELGCGRGEYTIGLAERFKDKNFIGIDIKGDRIFKGALKAREDNMKNVAFLRIKIQELIDHFGEDEVSEIWITFPDPRPKKRDEKRRLTSLRFMNMYYKILKNGGRIHLKTDSKDFFQFTIDSLKNYQTENIVSTFDLYNSALNEDHFGIMTRYEEKFTAQGFSINYIRFNIKKPTF